MSSAKNTDQPKPRPLTADDIALLLRHHAQIGRTHPAFYTAVGFVSSTTGGGTITLGGMLRLWTLGLWVIPCSRCGGRLHLIFLGGSMMSGNNRATGVCLDCQVRLVEPLPARGKKFPTHFSKFFDWGMAASRGHAMPMITKSEPRHGFDWGTGLTPDPVDAIITQVPQFTPMPVDTLLAELRAQEAAALAAESSSESDPGSDIAPDRAPES